MSTEAVLMVIAIAWVLLLLEALGLASAASASDRLRRFRERRVVADRRYLRRSTPDRRRTAGLPADRW